MGSDEIHEGSKIKFEIQWDLVRFMIRIKSHEIQWDLKFMKFFKSNLMKSIRMMRFMRF